MSTSTRSGCSLIAFLMPSTPSAASTTSNPAGVRILRTRRRFAESSSMCRILAMRSHHGPYPPDLARRDSTKSCLPRKKALIGVGATMQAHYDERLALALCELAPASAAASPGQECARGRAREPVRAAGLLFALVLGCSELTVPPADRSG